LQRLGEVAQQRSAPAMPSYVGASPFWHACRHVPYTRVSTRAIHTRVGTCHTHACRHVPYARVTAVTCHVTEAGPRALLAHLLSCGAVYGTPGMATRLESVLRAHEQVRGRGCGLALRAGRAPEPPPPGHTASCSPAGACQAAHSLCVHGCQQRGIPGRDVRVLTLLPVLLAKHTNTQTTNTQTHTPASGAILQAAQSALGRALRVARLGRGGGGRGGRCRALCHSRRRRRGGCAGEGATGRRKGTGWELGKSA
jgi:hypothetical protein